MMKPPKWSKAETARLRELWHELPTRLISEDLGRTVQAVCDKGRKLGLSRRAVAEINRCKPSMPHVPMGRD